METKFIEGTNQQYSIREDGVIIKHYNNTRGIKSYKDKILCIHNGLSTIYILKKKTTVSISYLLFDYFGFKYCNKCNCKFTRERNDFTCKNCLIDIGNYPKSKLQIKVRNLKRTEKITKSYISSLVKIKVAELDDKIYSHHKSLLKFKRKVSEEHKVSIKKLI
jgi:hypothetical protein